MKDILVKIFSGTVTFGTLYLVLEYLSDNFALNPKIKKKLADTILSLHIPSVFSIFREFISDLLNIIYTKDHFSWKCFRRSFVTSGIFMLFLHAIFFFKNSGTVGSLTLLSLLPFLSSFLFFLILYNTLDFFLLWKTRRLLDWLSGKGSKYGNYILLIDTVSSFLFGFIKYCLIVMLVSLDLPNLKYFFSDVVPIKVPAGYPQEVTVIPGLFFYGSFVYSAFLLFYYFSVYLCRKARSLEKVKRFFYKFYDISEEPVMFLKFILGLVVFTVVAAALFIQLIF